jgi:hypothetical protein
LLNGFNKTPYYQSPTHEVNEKIKYFLINWTRKQIFVLQSGGRLGMGRQNSREALATRLPFVYQAAGAVDH